MARTLRELVNLDDPGWPFVAELIAHATNKIEVLPVEREKGEAALLAIQVTTRSPMGAIAYESGGLLVDHGWIRVLGGGHPRLPRNIGAWNFPSGAGGPSRLPGAMLVADDVIGGFFAINGGAFEGPPGHVFYFAPNSLVWEDTSLDYTNFVNFLCVGDLARFYEGMRWREWQRDVPSLSGARAFSFYPFLSSREGADIEKCDRRDVPIEEIWKLFVLELPRQLGIPRPRV